jgi:predicted permease
MQSNAWLERIFRDTLYALRQLARNRLFSIVALASLAIGIGANTAIFSVLNAALLKSLPVPDPQELVMLTDPNATGVSSGLDTGERHLLSYAEFVQLRGQATVFSGMCASEAELNRWHVRIGGMPTEEARARLVSEEYFSVLKVQPIIGRLFIREDAKAPGQDPYAVISYDYWQRRFGGKASVLGTLINIGNATLTVIGVTAPGFHGETVGENPDLWMPMLMQPSVIPGRDWLNENTAQNIEKIMWLHALGRLKPGISKRHAQTELDLVFRRIIENGYPTTLSPEVRKQVLDQRLELHDAATGVFAGREDFSQQLLLLLGASLVVLVIACINVANLLLARASARSKEMAVRLSIGASRGRLVWQVLTESLVLAFLGGCLGIVLAWQASQLLANLLASTRTGLELSPNLDWRVLLFALGVTFLTGIIFGVGPALRGSDINLNDSLRDTGRVTSSAVKLNLSRGLVVGQVGLSLLAVILAGLLLRTLWNLQGIDLGYPKEKLLLITVDGVSAGYRGMQLPNLWRDLTARLEALPGVAGVTYSINGLFTGSEAEDEMEVEGFVPRQEDEKSSRFDMVGPRYFSVVGIPLLRGREFTFQDGAQAPHVCVINESFANRFFAGRDPMGRHVIEKFGEQKNVMEVVGVVKDARDHALRGEVPPRFYVAGDQGMQGPNEWATFEIRTARDPELMLSAVRKAIVGLNEKLYPGNGRPLVESLEHDVARPRMISRLCTAFGIAGLLLAAGGLYGVLSYGVAKRTNEIGIRMALGAGPRAVIGMILRETGVMIGLGAVIGTGLTLACTRIIAARLYGLSTLDPVTIGASVAILAIVGLVAGYLPAARAAHVNPIAALRHE